MVSGINDRSDTQKRKGEKCLISKQTAQQICFNRDVFDFLFNSSFFEFASFFYFVVNFNRMLMYSCLTLLVIKVAASITLKTSL